MLSNRALISTTYISEMPLSETKKVELINAASDIFERETGINYALATNVENYDTTKMNSRTLLLNNFPVVSIEEVVLRGAVLDPNEYYYNKNIGAVGLTGAGASWYSSVPNDVKITYVSGYSLGNAPYDIQQAVKNIVVQLMNAQAQDDPNQVVISEYVKAIIARRRKVV